MDPNFLPIGILFDQTEKYVDFENVILKFFEVKNNGAWTTSTDAVLQCYNAQTIDVV